MPKLISDALLDSMRKPSVMVDDMLDKELETLEADLGRKAKGVGNHLMSLLVQNGNRIQWEEDALLDEMTRITELDRETLKGVLHSLQEVGIIRQTVGQRYEMANSFLARRANQKLEADNRVLRGIQTTIRDHQERDDLLDEKYINYIESSISLNLLTPEERQFVKASKKNIYKRRWNINTLRVAAFLVLAALAFYNISLYRSARKNNQEFQKVNEELIIEKNRAEAAEVEASQKADEAEQARVSAEEARVLAEEARTDALLSAEEAEALRKIAFEDRDSISSLNEQTAAQAAILKSLSEEAERKAQDYKALKELAEKRAEEARIAQQKAEQYNKIITSWNVANQALLIEDPRTKALVAKEAYNVNLRYPDLGNIYNPNIVKALFESLRSLNPDRVFREGGKHTADVQAIAFRPQLDRFYTAGGDGKLLQWDIREWNNVGTPNLRGVKELSVGSTTAYQSLSLSPSGDFMLVGGQGGELLVINTFNGNIMSRYTIPQDDRILISKWLDDEQFMAAGESKFYSYNKTDGFQSYSKMKSNVNWIEKRGDELVGYTFVGKLRDYIYRIEMDSVRAGQQGRREFFLRVGGANTMNYGNLSSVGVGKRKDGRSIYAFGFSNGRIILAANEPGDPQFMSLSTSEKKDFKLYQSAISVFDFSEKKDFLAVGNVEGAISIWDLNQYIEPSYQPMVYEGVSDLIYSLKFSPDGTFILAGDRSGAVSFLNVEPADYADAICEELSSNFGAFRTEQTEINKVLKRRFRADFSFDQLSSKEYSRYFEDIVQEEGELLRVRVCDN
ncbi:MAG: hypothetical protein HRU41_27355 [Saprospiraceae bacterium]|nr:hypothetical protein [Saprospiraceae bacterium]